MSDSKKKSNFLVQGSILAVASIISRIIGLLYRLPMTDIIGDLGNDYYSAAFELYSVMLMISLSSLIPESISLLSLKYSYIFIFIIVFIFVVLGILFSSFIPRILPNPNKSVS